MHLLLYVFHNKYITLCCCYLSCFLQILFLYPCLMNIMHKLLTIITTCKSMSSLPYIQRFFSKMRLEKTSLLTHLKQTNLKNWLHISIESSKEGFNDTVFQHFVDELKHCNLDIWMDLQLLVPGFLCLCLYLVVMLPIRMIFFHNCFLCEFAIF